MALFLTCHTACPFYSSFIKRHDLGWGLCYHSANTGEADCCLWVCHITPVRIGVDEWAVFYKQENYPQRDWFLYQLLSHPALLKALWTLVCLWVSATDNERMWSLVVKIQVINVENNSVNEILFGRHLTLRSLLSQPLVLQNIARMGNALLWAKFICSSSHSCTLYPGWSFYLSSMISPESENTGSRKAIKQTRQYSQQTV